VNRFKKFIQQLFTTKLSTKRHQNYHQSAIAHYARALQTSTTQNCLISLPKSEITEMQMLS
jgi:hypothetical protein